MLTLPSGAPRAQRLKAGTEGVHQGIDQRIMARDIFASRADFTRFVQVQHRLHRDVQALYACPQLRTLLPSLAGRQRLALIERDLLDLGASLDADAACPVTGSVAHCLGWLYVVEGSALGGAVILKRAARLGLHAQFGARHLAPAHDGVATAWRRFTAELDAVALDDAEDAQVLEGANAAFRRVAVYVDHTLY
jgi:heme oxygenase